MNAQQIEGLTQDQFNAAVPVQLQEKYNAAAGAYVMRQSDLRSWAIVMLKYPTITQNGQYKIRVSLAIKTSVAGKEQWNNIETGLTAAEKLLEAGFLSESEAENALEWIEENATEEGNVHARMRLLPQGTDSYMAISLRVNRRPGEAGQPGELAKNPVAIKQLMLNGFTLERESAIVAGFDGLELPIPAKITLKTKPVKKAAAVAVVEETEEVYEVKPSAKKAAVAAGISF